MPLRCLRVHRKLDNGPVDNVDFVDPVVLFPPLPRLSARLTLQQSFLDLFSVFFSFQLKNAKEVKIKWQINSFTL